MYYPSFSGITREQYFTALRGGEEIKFVCEPCVARIPPRDNDGVEVSLYMCEKNLHHTPNHYSLKYLEYVCV